jgi:1-acyl-sn-glycerol-3-phosphate acyltransferase
MNRPVRFACHYYMGRVPLLREMVSVMGAFPLDAPNRRQKNFFRQALKLLRSGQPVGVFPEGAKPMIERNAPEQLNPFHRGFAHLALRAPMDDLAILPVAIASIDEATHHLAPLKLFSLVDPSEPLFHGDGWHRATMYRRVHLLFGHPVWISDTLRKQYRGHHGGSLARELTHSCWSQISGLLQQGCC